jgi:hypothetical protein
VVESLRIDSSRLLVDANLPILRFIHDIRRNNTATVNLPRGIWIVKPKHVHPVETSGIAPYCSSFDLLWCHSVIVGNYSCGATSNQSMNMVVPSCVGSWERIGFIDPIRWWSERLLPNCDESLSVRCTFGPTLCIGFLIEAGLLLIGASIIRFVVVRRRLGRSVQLKAVRTRIR